MTELFDETPDVAGPIARCGCGTTLGPVTAPANVTFAVRCLCGVVLEAWPAGSREEGDSR